MLVAASTALVSAPVGAAVIFSNVSGDLSAAVPSTQYGPQVSDLSRDSGNRDRVIYTTVQAAGAVRSISLLLANGDYTGRSLTFSFHGIGVGGTRTLPPMFSETLAIGPVNDVGNGWGVAIFNLAGVFDFGSGSTRAFGVGESATSSPASLFTVPLAQYVTNASSLITRDYDVPVSDVTIQNFVRPVVTNGPTVKHGLAFELNDASIESTVPEAATWALMIAGFGMVGSAMRRASYVSARRNRLIQA